MDKLNIVKHTDSKGEVDEYLLLEEYPEINYVLLKRDTNFQPFIAAWDYDKETVSWRNGHYFQDLLSAARYIQMLIDDKNHKINWHRMCEIASKAIDGLREDDEETAQEYCREVIEMDEDELEFFGLNESEDEDGYISDIEG